MDITGYLVGVAIGLALLAILLMRVQNWLDKQNVNYRPGTWEDERRKWYEREEEPEQDPWEVYDQQQSG